MSSPRDDKKSLVVCSMQGTRKIAESFLRMPSFVP